MSSWEAPEADLDVKGALNSHASGHNLFHQTVKPFTEIDNVD